MNKPIQIDALRNQIEPSSSKCVVNYSYLSYLPGIFRQQKTKRIDGRRHIATNTRKKKGIGWFSKRQRLCLVFYAEWRFDIGGSGSPSVFKEEETTDEARKKKYKVILLGALFPYFGPLTIFL